MSPRVAARRRKGRAALAAASPRPLGNVHGRELRAWTVRAKGGRSYHVAETEQGPGFALSERGLNLTCGCMAFMIRRWCEHARAVALEIGGRDVARELSKAGR